MLPGMRIRTRNLSYGIGSDECLDVDDCTLYLRRIGLFESYDRYGRQVRGVALNGRHARKLYLFPMKIRETKALGRSICVELLQDQFHGSTTFPETYYDYH